MAKEAGCSGVDVLYIVYNLPWIETKSLEDEQNAL
jgi:hypothetical protein